MSDAAWLGRIAGAFVALLITWYVAHRATAEKSTSGGVKVFLWLLAGGLTIAGIATETYFSLVGLWGGVIAGIVTGRLSLAADASGRGKGSDDRK